VDSRSGNREPARLAQRSRGLRLHFAAYFMLILVLVPINLIVTPETPWFIWPMVGWGSVLAIHTAWAMGLFDILSSKD
jgi:2TM domain